MSTLPILLDNAVVDFQQPNYIPEGYIPDGLNPMLKQATSDAQFRAKSGVDAQTWWAVTKCLASGLSATGEGHKRYLNGLVLLARTLVCTSGAGTIAWELDTGEKAIELLACILNKQGERSQGDEKLLASLLQFLANLSSEVVSSSSAAAPAQVPLLDSLFERIDNEKATRNLCREFGSDNAKTVLVLLETASNQDPAQKLPLFVNTNPGKTIFVDILTHTERWFTDDHEADFTILVNRFIKHIVSNGLGKQFLRAFDEQHTTPDQHLSLLKLFDAAIPSCIEENSVAPQHHVELALAYYDQLEIASTKALPFITAMDTSPEYSHGLQVEITNIWNSLVVVLDTIHAVLEPGAANSHEVKVALLSKPLVKSLVELLGETHKNLPQKSKLADVERANEPERDLDPLEFPLIKGKIITILSQLGQQNKQVQDEVRERHGLDVVLSNCIIDLNNPFIRERSILCIKYLLEDNPESQRVVADLEAKQPVSEEAIKEAGYETEVINGKLALRKA